MENKNISKEHSTPSEVKSSSANQEIRSRLRSPNLPYRCHSSTHLGPIPDQMNPLHSPKHYFLNPVVCANHFSYIRSGLFKIRDHLYTVKATPALVRLSACKFIRYYLVCSGFVRFIFNYVINNSPTF